jgi:plasmid stabilization system protein ParE
MAFPYRLHQSAHQEYIDAYEWYELRQKGLGNRFMKSVEECLERISTHPEYFNKRKGNFRAAKVKGFPYSIVFEFYKLKRLIHIAAIYHSKRSPIKKYRRIKP